MKTFTRPLVFLACAALIPIAGLAGDVVQMQFNPSVREYCHIVRFPSGWQMPKVVLEKNGRPILPYFPLRFGFADYFEFRVSGLLNTRFLVRGVELVVDKYYTSNLYEVDLSDPQGVAQPAREEEWNSATDIPMIRLAFEHEIKLPTRYPKYIEFHGLQFMSSGDHWESTIVSPDRGVLVMQSWTGKLAPGGSDIPGDFATGLSFGRNHGKLYFDIYNAETAKKLITMTAKFVTILPEEAFGRTGWITERYFLIPLDERRTRCLICEFGRKR
jgi:hypothetical protein